MYRLYIRAKGELAEFRREFTLYVTVPHVHDDAERHKRIDALDDFALSSDPAGCRTLKPARTLDADCRAEFAIDSTALSDGCNCF
jgi:hypothetical protein